MGRWADGPMGKNHKGFFAVKHIKHNSQHTHEKQNMAKKAKSKKVDDDDSDDGSLGKRVASFNAYILATTYFVVGGLLLFGGIALALLGLSQNDENPNRPMNIILGCLFIFGGVAPTVLGLWNYQTSLRVYRKGIRFRSWFKSVELKWKDIKRIDVTNYYKMSNDNFSETSVAIRARDGGKYVLGRQFMKLIGSPKVLVRLLEQNSGLDVGGMEEDF
jgi:hypothetical protein